MWIIRKLHDSERERPPVILVRPFSSFADYMSESGRFLLKQGDRLLVACTDDIASSRFDSVCGVTV